MSDGRPAANDEERLPWLEPYREPPTRRARPVKPARPKTAKSGRGGLLALLGVIGLGGALAGGFWLGQREGLPTSAQPPAEPRIALNTPPVASPPVAQTPAPAPVAAAPTEVSSGSAVVPMAASRPSPPKRKPARRPKIRSAGVETANIDRIKQEQGEPAPPPRVWPKQPSPGPAGRVIQLGAFSNPDRAYVTYRQRIARYPALGRMPRVIVPVARGREGRLLYVLRLGTGSRQQSKTVCRNLRRSGDHCLVIG